MTRNTYEQLSRALVAELANVIKDIKSHQDAAVTASKLRHLATFAEALDQFPKPIIVDSATRAEQRIVELMADGAPRTKNSIVRSISMNRSRTLKVIDKLITSGNIKVVGTTTNGYPLLALADSPKAAVG